MCSEQQTDRDGQKPLVELMRKNKVFVSIPFLHFNIHHHVITAGVDLSGSCEGHSQDILHSLSTSKHPLLFMCVLKCVCVCVFNVRACTPLLYREAGHAGCVYSTSEPVCSCWQYQFSRNKDLAALQLISKIVSVCSEQCFCPWASCYAPEKHHISYRRRPFVEIIQLSPSLFQSLFIEEKAHLLKL